MEIVIKKRKSALIVDYIDYLSAGEHNIAPVCTSYTKDEICFEMEIDDDDRNGRAKLLKGAVVTEVQFKTSTPDESGLDELLVTGDDIWKFISPLMSIYDNEKAYRYNGRTGKLVSHR